MIYRKTAKGQIEIETRAYGLAPRLRTALILVDGRRSDAQLRELVPNDTQRTFQTLLDDGYIEPGASEHGAQRAAASSYIGNPRLRAFERRRRESVAALLDEVGPLGGAVATQIERCSDWAELEPTLELARQVLAYARGESVAMEYSSRFIEIRPGHARA
jgi:hypothetical protein